MTETTTIQITMDSWRALNSRKRRPNETFDDVIQSLMEPADDGAERDSLDVSPVAADHDYTETDRRIVAFLQHDGRATAGLLNDELDRSKAQINRRLQTLRQLGIIRYRHEGTGLYEIA